MAFPGPGLHPAFRDHEDRGHHRAVSVLLPGHQLQRPHISQPGPAPFLYPLAGPAHPQAAGFGDGHADPFHRGDPDGFRQDRKANAGRLIGVRHPVRSLGLGVFKRVSEAAHSDLFEPGSGSLGCRVSYHPVENRHRIRNALRERIPERHPERRFPFCPSSIRILFFRSWRKNGVL